MTPGECYGCAGEDDGNRKPTVTRWVRFSPTSRAFKVEMCDECAARIEERQAKLTRFHERMKGLGNA